MGVMSGDPLARKPDQNEQRDLEATRTAIDTDPRRPGVQSALSEEWQRGYEAGAAKLAWVPIWIAFMAGIGLTLVVLALFR